MWKFLYFHCCYFEFLTCTWSPYWGTKFNFYRSVLLLFGRLGWNKLICHRSRYLRITTSYHSPLILFKIQPSFSTLQYSYFKPYSHYSNNILFIQASILPRSLVETRGWCEHGRWIHVPWRAAGRGSARTSWRVPPRGRPLYPSPWDLPRSGNIPRGHPCLGITNKNN